MSMIEVICPECGRYHHGKNGSGKPGRCKKCLKMTRLELKARKKMRMC